MTRGSGKSARPDGKKTFRNLPKTFGNLPESDWLCETAAWERAAGGWRERARRPSEPRVWQAADVKMSKNDGADRTVRSDHAAKSSGISFPVSPYWNSCNADCSGVQGQSLVPKRAPVLSLSEQKQNQRVVKQPGPSFQGWPGCCGGTGGWRIWGVEFMKSKLGVGFSRIYSDFVG